jgi:hypothetical protein
VTLRPARRQGGLICRRMKVNAAVPGSGIPERQAPAEQVVAQVAASERGAAADEFGAARNRVPLGTGRLLAQHLGKPVRTGEQAECQGFAYFPPSRDYSSKTVAHYIL